MSYLGYLFNGSVFDATANHGGTPFTLTLDDTPTRDFIAHNQSRNLIDGWEQGLQGMKQGETRVLIIPSSLGYGVNGSPPSIPSNAPLVFETFLNELDYAPAVAVGGIDFSVIPPASTTTDTTNGTDFGTLSPGQTSISQTFPLADFSNAFDATGARIQKLNYNNITITLSGPNAADFALSSLNPITLANGTPQLGNFTISFNPTGLGLRTATVHLHSNDQFNPDYTFNIQATNTSAISLSGNSIAIASGDTTPSTADFTSFGYQLLSPPAAVTRTYTLTNTGATVISLANITIAGANPADFTLSSPPALSSLNPNDSTTFTITFNPTAAGLRDALVSIPSSAGSSYTFAIDGTGVSQATNTGPGGAFVATIQPGIGPAAVDGDILHLNYVGTFLTGESFSGTIVFRLDNSATHSYINLDQSPSNIKNLYDLLVPVAFEQTAQGIKLNETRIVVLATLFVGPFVPPNLPSNANLVLSLTCTDLQFAPQFALTGNNLPIATGATTPNAADGTDLGPVAFGHSTSHAFAYNNNTLADTATGAPVPLNASASITGPDAADFSITSDEHFLVVTFQPSANLAGTRNATIHIHSDDPTTPDISFAIQGNVPLLSDLQLSLGTTAFPATTINTNSNASLTLPVNITNVGNATTDPNATTDVQIFARNAATGLITPVATYTASIAQLPPGQSITFSFNAPIPLTLPTGTYTLLVVMNQSNASPDSNLANNSASTLQTFSVNAIYTNLTPTLLSTTLPKSLLAKTPMSGTITFNIVNTGTLPLPKTQQATVTLLARNTTTGATTTLLTLPPQSLANLKPLASIKVTTPLIKLPTGLPAGTYTLQARITPTQKISQSSTTDDTGTSTFSLTVNPPTYDLTGPRLSSTLKSTPKGVSGNLNLSLRSLGNTNLPANQTAQLQIIAHPTTALNAAADILLTTLTEKLANLAPQKSLNFTLKINSTKILHAGRYQIEIRILTTPRLAETNTLNNLLTQKPLFLLSTNK